MDIPEYSKVRFVTDRFTGEGVPKGTLGYIIAAYDNGDYEIEVSDPSGITLAQVVAREGDLEIAESLA